MRNHYRLLVLDIDGTLLNRGGFISEEDKKTLDRVRNSGMPISLSTGRVAQACLKILDWLSLDGVHMFCDGALVSNPETGEEIYSHPIDASVVGQCIEFAHANNIALDLYSTTSYFIERETWSSNVRRHFFGITPKVLNFNDLDPGERIIKGALVAYTPEEKARAADFYRAFKGRLRFSYTTTPAYPGVDFINVIAPDVSKGKALEALTSHVGIMLSDVIAIGDGTNDISLLTAAGTAIAMGNAPAELKEVADHVTLDVEQSGVAAAINKFLFD